MSLRSHGGEAGGRKSWTKKQKAGCSIFTISRQILVFVLKLPIFCADVLKCDPLNHPHHVFSRNI